uniref:Protein kinase C-binding protein 1 n=1 Tax=Anopheles atroparvus TaxID=41427 RepID=A0AAG5CTI2_ANOAO
MSSGDLEAPTTAGSIATQTTIGKIRILQGQLMIPGRAETVPRATASDQQHRRFTPGGIENPTTSFDSTTNLSEKGKMRMKVTGEDTRAAAATKGQAVPALRTVSPSDASHKASSPEASDRHKLPTPENARASAVATDSLGRMNHVKHTNWLPVRSLGEADRPTSSSFTDSAPNATSRVPRTVATSDPSRVQSEPLVIRGATTDAGSSVRILTAPLSLKGESVAYTTSLLQTNKSKQVLQQQPSKQTLQQQPPITVSYRPINQQPAPTVAMQNNTVYKVLHVASKSSNQSSSDSTERTAIVLKKMSNGADKNLSSSSSSSSSSLKKSTHDRGMENHNRALPSSAVEGNTQTGDETRGTREHRSQVSASVQTEQQPLSKEKKSAKGGDTVAERSNEASDKSSTQSVDAAGKVSREVKLLKETQSQSKILAEYIDDASRQGKLRVRRSASGTPTSTTVATPPVSTATGPVAHRKRLQSRCFAAEDDPTLALDTGSKRPGMRSESIEFRMKNRKFLNDIQDKGDMALADDYEEAYEEPEEMHRYHPVGISDSDLNVSIDSKQLDDTLSSLPEPPKPGYDRFCFRCKIAKNDCLVGCSTCIRSFHKGCARPTYSEATWSCHDCRASTLAHETKPFPTEGDVNLPECLKYALESILYSADVNRLFNPVDKTAISLYESVVTNHMDLATISDKVEAKKYATTEDFLSDLSWIVHNMTICRDTKMLASAKSLYRTGREEIILLETCRECFLHFKTKPEATWFVEACKKPHLLVWGKVKGFPYWPGKLMNINSNNQVLVVFFGQHDKAWIAVKECFVLSKRDPNPKSSKKSYWNKSLKEVEEHVANLILKFGCFNYAPYLTALDAARIDDHLREMLPNAFNPIGEVPVRQEPVVLTIITSVDGKMTASATTSDKAATDTAGAGESSQKRITRRASKAVMVYEDYVNSMAVNTIEPPTEGEANNMQVLAKKRKSVCFERLVSEQDEEGKIESLLIRRNSGNWATEPVSKRRKSVSRARRDSQKFATSQDTNLTAPEDSSSDRAVGSSNVATAPMINDQLVDADVAMDEVLKTNDNDGCAGQNNSGSTTGNVAEVPELSNPNGREAANATVSTPTDVTLSPSGSKEPVDLGHQKVGNETEKSHPSVTATVDKASQPVISVPVPIKEEIPEAEEDVSSTSTPLTSSLEQPVVTAETKISASNQKARKSFPGSSATRAMVKPAGISNTMMTIIPKAIGPERNSPLLQPAGAATEEPVATSSTATSSEVASGDMISSSPLASVAPPASRSHSMVPAANEIPAVMLQRVASGVSRINNAIGNAVRSCAPESTVAPTGAASIATFPPAESTEINLPDDLDVIIIEEPDSEAAAPAASAVSSPARYANRSNRMPILHPKPVTSSKEGDDKFSVVDLIDNYVTQVADQSRNLFELTLGKLIKDGSLEAKVLDLTRQLELANRRHEMEMEQLKKQMQHLYNDKARAVSMAKQQMWCRRCQLEANFYCCWNTAYCSTKCQQEHWREHEHTCEQKVFDDRGSVSMSGTSSAYASPSYGLSAKKKGHARHRSVAGYQDQPLSASSTATTVAPPGSKVMSTIPVGQRLVSSGAPRRQQPSFMTPKIHMVHSQATSLHNLPYSGNVVNGGTAQRRLPPPSSSASTSARAEQNNDERRVPGAHTLASSVSNGTMGRIISAAPSGTIPPTITFTSAGRGGSTSSSTSRPAPPLPPGVWNQFIVQPPPVANAPTGGATFVDSSVYGIGGPRGVGGFMHSPATVAGGSVSSALGTTNNGSLHGDAGLVRDTMARRHPR